MVETTFTLEARVLADFSVFFVLIDIEGESSSTLSLGGRCFGQLFRLLRQRKTGSLRYVQSAEWRENEESTF